jgi:hypothetical protein
MAMTPNVFYAATSKSIWNEWWKSEDIYYSNYPAFNEIDGDDAKDESLYHELSSSCETAFQWVAAEEHDTDSLSTKARVDTVWWYSSVYFQLFLNHENVSILFNPLTHKTPFGDATVALSTGKLKVLATSLLFSPCD